jgi:tetratricopeptide (TPR) repeat protein
MSEGHRVSQLIGRFRRTPALRHEVWQGGVVRLPVWIEPADGSEPFRPFGAFWVSLSSGRIDVRVEPERDGHGAELVLEGLLQFTRQEEKLLHGRASRLHVADPSVRDYLARALADADVQVELVPRVEALDRAAQEYCAMVKKEEWGDVPALLTGDGVTVEVVSRFAEAAARYYAAAPWQHLSDEDLIEIESPHAPRCCRFALVLGNAGHTFGLGFYESREQYESMRAGFGREDSGRTRSLITSVVFDSPDAIPLDDHDLWLDSDLPLAGPRAYPFPAHYLGGGKCERFSREELEFAVGILAAFAETTEEEMDSGRWTKRVSLGAGSIKVRLSLPLLLDPGRPGARVGLESRRRASEQLQAEIHRFVESHEFASLEEANEALNENFLGRSADDTRSTASTPAERAQDLAYQAYEWTGRKRVQLARQALELWPDCAEAYIVLAEHAANPEAALPLYERAVEVGRRALGQDFDRLAGQLWAHVEARPYMRARLELAETLESLGRADEAIDHFQNLLRLNVNDNQGVRDLLVPRLLARGRHAEAAAVLDKYPDDVAAMMAYCKTLHAFQTEGDSEAARAALAAAVVRNRYVPEHLTRPDDDDVSEYTLGSEEEAITVGRELGEVWRQTPGALEWLDRQVRARRAEKRAAARKRQKKANRGRP